MKANYKTLAESAVVQIIIKRSRFISSVLPVSSEQEAVDFIGKIKKEHGQANHNVFAYVINEQIQRCSDDGEPSGTAGKPVLDAVRFNGLVKVVIVVTRYFGGIMLGAGGLVRAYSEAAVKGIEASKVVEKVLHQELLITMDYQWLGLVKREVEKAGGANISIDFDQKVIMKVYLEPEPATHLLKKITDSTAAQVNIQTGEYIYI